MGLLSHFLYPWGLILQGLAIVHFIRRRPDTFWIFVILFLGPIGALIYLCVEAIPDVGLLGDSFKFFSRRNRIGQLEAIVRQNPSAGNYEELGDLYMDNGQFQQARAAFDHAITPRTDSPDPFYRRGVCALRLNDPQAAIPDLEQVVASDPGYDFTSPPAASPRPALSPARRIKPRRFSVRQLPSPLPPRPTSTSPSY